MVLTNLINILWQGIYHLSLTGRCWLCSQVQERVDLRTLIVIEQLLLVSKLLWWSPTLKP